MRRQGLLLSAGALAVLSLFGAARCGGGSTAKDPSTDPTTKPDDSAPKWDSNSEPSATTKSSAATADPTARSGMVYDKDATEVVLKRGERQVKDNCGHAKDADNKLTGPYGKVTVTLVLGHNGHMKEVKVPAPFEGKPTGACIVNCFDNLIFPPWHGPDTSVDREVEVVKPQ
jgi:hypothetical protein